MTGIPPSIGILPSDSTVQFRMCQLLVLTTHYLGCSTSCDTLTETLQSCGNPHCSPFSMFSEKTSPGQCPNHSRKSSGNLYENPQSTIHNEQETQRSSGNPSNEILGSRPQDQTNEAKDQGSSAEGPTSIDVPNAEHEEQQSMDAGITQPSDVDLVLEPGYYVVHPSLPRILMDWISKERRAGGLSMSQLRELEIVVSELQHIHGKRIYISLSDPGGIINTFKGKLEELTGEIWDWWPLKPHMRALAEGQVRLKWECTCGDVRWAEVPLPFARTVNSASKTLAAPDHSENQPNQQSLASQDLSSSPPHQVGIEKPNNPSTALAVNPQAASNQQPDNKTASASSQKPDRHVFLVLIGFSIFGGFYCLAQTKVNAMDDREFFAWIRTAYYTHRGFLSAWFGLSKYSHCEFFRFRRFDGYEYTPLKPEYPDERQPSYHFDPKPMEPQPPMAPEEFRHWFYKQSWHGVALRKFSRRQSWPRPWDMGSNVVLNQKIPKRDAGLEEGVPASEDFWGLYVVTKRSTCKAALYSLMFLSPSVYFFFAWLFQWHHSGGLQNASVPIALSLTALGTFWGCILMTSPRSAQV